jgi:hypothetical protein
MRKHLWQGEEFMTGELTRRGVWVVPCQSGDLLSSHFLHKNVTTKRSREFLYYNYQAKKKNKE